MCLASKQYTKLPCLGLDSCYVSDLVHFVHYTYTSMPETQISRHVLQREEGSPLFRKTSILNCLHSQFPTAFDLDKQQML